MLPSFVLFGRTIGMYPVMALAGGLCAGAYSMWAARRRGLNDQPMLELLLWAALGCFLGGALLYSALNIGTLRAYWQVAQTPYTPKTFLAFLQLLFGGSVFYGGLLGGLFAGLLYVRHKKLPLGTYADMAAPAIPLFHFFGRIGCFLGGCCYGVPWAHGVTFTRSLVASANGVPRFPVQLLEAGFNLALFLLLASLLARGRCKGRLLALYLLVYPTARFCFEYLRGDAYRGFLWGLSTSQWISLALLLFLGIFLLFSPKKTRNAKSTA